MNTVLKNSLITGLLFIIPQLTHAADDSGMPSTVLGGTKQPINKAQYVIPPASPYFTVIETDKSKILEHLAVGPKTTPQSISNNAKSEDNEQTNVIRQLTIELEDNKKQTTSLFEQLHATATAADFDNEMYSKTVILLQKEIQSLKQNSEDANALKSAYAERDKEFVKLNNELNFLKEQASSQTNVVASSNLEIKTLREAFAMKSKEAQDLSAKLISYEQTQEELVDLQNESIETNEDNALLKAKLVELDGLNTSLNTQLNDLKLNSEKQSMKLGLLNQTSGELNTIKNNYNELKVEVDTLKGQLLEAEGSNKALTSEIDLLKSESNTNNEKLGLLSGTSEELASLKILYIERNEEAANLKEELLDTEDSKNLLLTEIEALKSQSAEYANKATLLDQSSTELTALKSAYQEKSDESDLLKEKLTQLEEGNESLTAQTVTLQAALDQNLEKLKVIDQKSAEIEAMTASYEEQSNEVLRLKDLLLETEGKLTSFDQTNAELGALKTSYKELKDQVVLLQEQKSQVEEANKILIARIDALNKDANVRTQKLGLLNQASSDLSALKDAYKERDDEATLLKEQKTQLEEANGILSTRIDGYKQVEGEVTLLKEQKIQLEEANGILSTRIDGYKQIENEVTLLKEQKVQLEEANGILNTSIDGYKQIEDEVALLKKQKIQLDEANEILIARIDGYKQIEGDIALLKEQKIQLDEANEIFIARIDGYKQVEGDVALLKEQKIQLDEANEILIARIDGYKQVEDEASLLKEQKIQLEKANEVLASEVDAMKNEASLNAKKLGLLDQATVDLEATKKAFEERNIELDKLKSDIAGLSEDKTSLLSQLEDMKSKENENTTKLAMLAKSSSELDELKVSYKDRNDENIELKKKLFELNKSIDALNDDLDKLKSANLESQKIFSDDAAKLKSDLELTNKALAGKDQALTNLNGELDELNKRLAESEKLGKTLTSELTALNTTAQELEALKKAIKELEEEKLAISNKLTESLKDNDKDGVVNGIDQCPASPLNSLVNNKGCIEIADKDGDKVADADDLCPDTSPNAEVNSFGCNANENITLEGVNFTSGSDRLTNSSLTIIDGAASTLKKNTSIEIEVAGHTDSLGDGTINQQLSLRRANSVAAQLISQGVDESRITTKGYGEEQPIATNDTQSGRLTNRRVELRIR